MINLSFKHDFTKLERALIQLADRDLKIATATALTRVATAARTEVMAQLPKVFDRPTPFTVNSIRYVKASKDSLSSQVYISEDAPKGVSPRNYLAAEMMGGPRRDKRSERALASAGLMAAADQLVPGRGATLDAYGNVGGPAMVQILSRLSAMGEQGYQGNVSARVKKRLAKQKLAHKRTGTNFFIAHSKGDGRPLGVWQIVSKGVVQPVLAFVAKRPNYQPRFPFEGMVAKVARARFPAELIRALREEIDRRK